MLPNHFKVVLNTDTLDGEAQCDDFDEPTKPSN